MQYALDVLSQLFPIGVYQLFDYNETNLHENVDNFLLSLTNEIKQKSLIGIQLTNFIEQRAFNLKKTQMFLLGKYYDNYGNDLFNKQHYISQEENGNIGEGNQKYKENQDDTNNEEDVNQPEQEQVQNQQKITIFAPKEFSIQSIQNPIHKKFIENYQSKILFNLSCFNYLPGININRIYHPTIEQIVQIFGNNKGKKLDDIRLIQLQQYQQSKLFLQTSILQQLVSELIQQQLNGALKCIFDCLYSEIQLFQSSKKIKSQQVPYFLQINPISEYKHLKPYLDYLKFVHSDIINDFFQKIRTQIPKITIIIYKTFMRKNRKNQNGQKVFLNTRAHNELKQEFINYLKINHEDINMNFLLLDGQHYEVDFYIPKFNLFIEFHGPNHYLRGTSQLSPRSVFLQELKAHLIKNKYKGFYQIIHYFEWKEMNQNQKIDFFKRKGF